MSRIIRILRKAQEERARTVIHYDNPKKLSISLDEVKDSPRIGAISRQSKTIKAADFVLEEYESLEEEFFELQKEQKTALLKLGNVLEELKELARTE